MKDNRNQLMTLAEQRIRLLYTNAYEQAMKIAEVRKALDAATDESFTFKANPRAEKELRKILEELGLKLDNLIVSGKKKLAKDGVEMAENNILAKVAASQKPLAERLIEASVNAVRSGQAVGMNIANEKRGGVKLSANVWKAVESSRKELEIIIQNNIIEGKGADVASREVRQYLRDPNRLYRRVKDKTTGEYKLSKAAQQYHPGQGRYRSSYMNARRLAVTEMNMATQAAECSAYANNPLIAGYEIRLSNNHTVKDPRHPGKVKSLHDICDELQGKYPPTFKFTSWHPMCRCTMIPILISPEERRKLAQARAEGKDYTPQGIITDVPANYKAWVAKNQERIASAKTLPFFLQDNGEMTKDGYVVNLNATTAPEPTNKPDMEGKRHVERTKNEIVDIRQRWNKRRIDRIAEYTQDGLLAPKTLKFAVPEMEKLNGNEDFDKLLQKLDEFESMAKRTEEMRNTITNTNLTHNEKSAIARNNIYIEDLLKTKKSEPMSIKDADEQKANPNYGLSEEYETNCQVCTVAYEMRKRGFDVVAGVADKELSTYANWVYKWKNADNTAPKIETFTSWLNDKNYERMTPKRFMAFLNEKCVEDGTYEIGFHWKTGDGHYAIIEKVGGKIMYVDPQVDILSGRYHRKEDINDVASYIWPYLKDDKRAEYNGIMRIDNKTFNTNYVHVLSVPK